MNDIFHSKANNRTIITDTKLLIILWQGFRDLFQTFEGLDDVKYIDEEIKAVEDLMSDSECES